MRTAVTALALVACLVLLVALLPVTLAALASVWLAWLRGWPPGRLYSAAAWCLPMVAAWLAAALVAHGLQRAAEAPYLAWLAMWHHAAAGHELAAAVLIAPAAIPVGLLAGGAAWSARRRAMGGAAGGRSPAAAVAFDQRQWRHQARSAAALLAAPGSVPLTSAAGDVLVGAVIRAVGHRPRRVATLPFSRLCLHQVVVGGTGTGKTTLLLRLWAAFMATGLQRFAAGQGAQPLVLVIDCKGGADARRIADRARRVLRDAGARSVAIWPDEASLNLWALPAEQLINTLVDLIEHGTGGAAYYADVLEAVVTLAVQAPAGTPASTADFLGRLDIGWLTIAYATGGHDSELALVRSAARHLPDIALRYRTLFRRLGSGLDGPGSLADADAWYCILEGTAEITVAEAQARALVDLLASFITGHAGQARRQVLLAVDEFSAVSRRLPIWQLYERARSLGLAVQVSAQSWHGLAADEDERYRIATAAEGGIWLLRTAHPEPVAGLAGQRKVVDSARTLISFPRWSRHGSSRISEQPVVDNALIRGLDVGQAAYLYRGGVSYLQVKRVVAGPAAVAGVARPQTPDAPAGLPAVAERGRMLPDISPVLDAAFGPAIRIPAADAGASGGGG
jgi:hypothetical protein